MGIRCSDTEEASEAQTSVTTRPLQRNSNGAVMWSGVPEMHNHHKTVLILSSSLTIQSWAGPQQSDGTGAAWRRGKGVNDRAFYRQPFERCVHPGEGVSEYSSSLVTSNSRNV